MELFIVCVFDEIFFFFLIETTGDFTGGKRDAFPYILASQENQNIFLPECVPENLSLGDPDHLKAAEINLLYTHWIRRQKKRLPPFIILKSNPQHGVAAKVSEKAKGKRKAEWVNVHSDDDSVADEGGANSDGGSDVGDEDRGGVEDKDEEEEEEEDATQPVKKGPPLGAKKIDQTLITASGSSKLPPPKARLTKKAIKGTNSANTPAQKSLKVGIPI